MRKLIALSLIVMMFNQAALANENLDCSKAESEITACYALTLGPKGCTQAIEEGNISAANTFSKRVAMSSMCAAAANNTYAKDFLVGDFVNVLFDETLESGCSKIESENILAKIFIGIPFCVGNVARWAQKMDAAKTCENRIKLRCGL